MQLWWMRILLPLLADELLELKFCEEMGRWSATLLVVFDQQLEYKSDFISSTEYRFFRSTFSSNFSSVRLITTNMNVLAWRIRASSFSYPISVALPPTSGGS